MIMELVSVTKVGDSLYIRIPKGIANDQKIEKSTIMELTVDNNVGVLIYKKKPAPAPAPETPTVQESVPE